MNKDDQNSKDDKKIPFSIQIDKQDIKLKVKNNIQKLADKFSWRKFLAKRLSKKRVLVITAMVILLGIGIFTQIYDSEPEPGEDYQLDMPEETVIQEEVLEVEEIIEAEDEVAEVEPEREIEPEADVDTDVAQEVAAKPNFVLPVQGGEVVQDYGWNKHPVLEDWRFNQGIDFLAAEATPIKAAKSGVIEEIREDNFLGLVIVLDHNDGYQTLYGHLNQLYLQEGQQVNAGEAIGEVGSSGLVIEPTLHFQILHQDEATDPSEYLDIDTEG
ncbi:M23 family metallopeptidase [Fuchsiella alkaliacetigena]|uniref:M23 family metallopeptidase n=1 Tax=Fuchsiella alkaliacetigena TaxID=957042 RepID=UPI00200AB952|nr:M23 family metallopeptidase [Fuchsiella alkaliacetigena]MCK8824576.1 M23 family metallopeptidase [Fuchsiella alkaliacetigena]